MKGNSLLRRTAALICAAVLFSSVFTCRAAGLDAGILARKAIFEALEHLGFEITAPIQLSTRPETEAVDESMLENACVIGHSHAVGMQMTLDIEGLDYIAEVGMMASSMQTHQEFSLPSGGIGSLRMGLSSKSYERIYVLLGSNDVLGGSSHLPAFRHEMEKLLCLIEEYQPDAEIFLLSIAPLGKSFFDYCKYHYAVTDDSLDEYNYVLRGLAVQHGIDYLDITSPLSGNDGFLSDEYDRGDGLHFNPEGNEQILHTILTHAEE